MAPASLFARLAVVAAAGLFVSGGGGQAQAPAPPTTAFAARVAALSEPGGYFDTDNLISNERDYLHVVPSLAQAGAEGGAYVGVGPDQNFSYIAAIRPDIVVIIDIRRDNMLLHLLFKALFEMARTRVDYLSMLTGRPVPTAVEDWPQQDVNAIVNHVDTTPVNRGALPALRARIESTVRSFGVALSEADLATIAGFHSRFIEGGLSLQFNTTGRAPQWHYPTFRDLVLGDDGTGRQVNYLASEDSFQFLKTLQRNDRIIPVVGDLAGTLAMREVGQFLRDQGESLSAFYASNVEDYLWRAGTYPRFLANLATFPRADHAVIIRSRFGRGGSVSEIAPVTTLIGARQSTLDRPILVGRAIAPQVLDPFARRRADRDVRSIHRPVQMDRANAIGSQASAH